MKEENISVNPKLEERTWKDIGTFEDACKALNIYYPTALSTVNQLLCMRYGRMLAALYQLGIIKQALNGDDWKPKLNEGRIYYSWLRWYPQGDKYPKEWEKVGMFRDLINHENYTLVGGGDCSDCDGGLGCFRCGYGDSGAIRGLLGCKSKEIAVHLTKYFGKIIFDAVFGQYYNYEWIDID